MSRTHTPQYKTVYEYSAADRKYFTNCPSGFRALLGTPFRLRDHIPRESVTPGLHSAIRMVSGHRRTPREGIRPQRDSPG